MQRVRTLIFLIVTFIIVGVVLFAILQLRNLLQDKPYTFNASSQTVIKELRKLNRLETASFTIEKVIDAGTSGNRFQEILFGDRLLLIAHGEVIAGFDLSGLNEDAVTVTDQSLTLRLPPPLILVTDLDNTQTRVYDRRQGILTKGDKDLEAAARNEAEKIITQAACDGNILNEASTNARSQLTTLFKTLGFTTVTVDIASGTC